MSALLFLNRAVLKTSLDWIDVTWAKKPKRLPIVLTREEVGAVLHQLQGVPLSVVQLLYGCGLRLNECLRLRVQDLDFGQRMIVVRDGKGQRIGLCRDLLGSQTHIKSPPGRRTQEPVSQQRSTAFADVRQIPISHRATGLLHFPPWLAKMA